MRRIAPSGWIVVCLAAAGCGSDGQDDEQVDVTDDDAPDDDSTDDDTGDDDILTGACPEAPPEPGTQCEEPWVSAAGVGLAYAHCSWGDDPRPQCRTLATCSNGSWVVNTPTDARCETEPLSDACPAEPATVGATCDDATIDCWYPDGDHCFCSPCEGGSEYPLCRTIDPPEWACVTPALACPPRIPQAGSVCHEPGSSCGPNCELQVVCEDEVWQWNQGVCPICAAPTTKIATPLGERDISTIAVGDLVYSVNASTIEAVPVLRVGNTPVAQHHVMRVTLQSGAVLELSPGHPTADGRLFGELLAGDFLDEQHRVLDAQLVPYAFERTFDILPGSDSGTYFAGGALVGSTLFAE